MIYKIGKYQLKEGGTIYVDPVLTPMKNPLLIDGVWDGNPRITVPILITVSGGTNKAHNLDKIPIDKIQFDHANAQDVNTLLGRISTRFDDFLVDENNEGLQENLEITE